MTQSQLNNFHQLFCANLLRTEHLDTYLDLDRKMKIGKAKMASCPFEKKSFSENVADFLIVVTPRK